MNRTIFVSTHRPNIEAAVASLWAQMDAQASKIEALESCLQRRPTLSDVLLLQAGGSSLAGRVDALESVLALQGAGVRTLKSQADAHDASLAATQDTLTEHNWKKGRRSSGG